MPDRKRSGLAYVAFAGILVLATEIAPVVTQERINAPTRPTGSMKVKNGDVQAVTSSAWRAPVPT